MWSTVSSFGNPYVGDYLSFLLKKDGNFCTYLRSDSLISEIIQEGESYIKRGKVLEKY